MPTFSFITDNLGSITAVAVAALALAEVVVRLTPTPKDDVIVGKVASFLNKYLNKEDK